ncbi:radical SAM protein [Sporanaerobium hydrogeniformans]|uniref:Radical SAM protein n=1 Tax=Sporanaerobium hydrogeniformans TaxID=3072179 RepID=A0AC61DEL8_9FIRM|nr:radical SAM protein [Sporanaerobium hydrogeniformans]PHV71248.1 radical SAM protein [Sporanaerobium hydrogeniformans]
MTDLEIIAYAEAQAETGKLLPRDSIIQLLAIETGSETWKELGAAARRVTSRLTHDRAYLWGAIGVDFAPCSMNCDFCSLGEAWGIVTTERKYDEEETVKQVREYVQQGVRWIVLRTTEFYSKEALMDMIRAIRTRVVGTYELGLNIGEFDLETANWLHTCGVDFIYHSLRLGEGKDTHFDPKVRIATLEAVKASPLKLVFLVEPVGIEHSNEEIADICLLAANCNAIVTGAMARIPVPGTPLGVYPQIEEERLAQIIAVTRLACGSHVPDICVHPGSQLQMEFGANVTVIETGSVPRDSSCCCGGKWNQFDATKAKELFQKAGYTVYATAEGE